jgi:hypothetical protein
MRAVLIAAISVVILIIGGFLIVANFSTVPREYVCQGETRFGGPPQKDAGRLRIEDYRWWVGLWSDSHGSAIFETKKVGRLSFVNLKKGDQGNFSWYEGLDPLFVFRRATGELIFERSGIKFVGECKEDR